MTKMDPEYKAEWLKRLRSGEYEQGKGYLNREGKFCCLGVLCEIGVERGDVVRHSPSPWFNTAIATPYTDIGIELPVAPWGARIRLPNKFAGSIGLYNQPEVHVDGDRLALADLNDEGATFFDIADLIEEQL